MTAIPDINAMISLMSGGGSVAPENIWFHRDGRIAAAASNTPGIGALQSLWLCNGTPGRGIAPVAPAIPDNTTDGGLKQVDPTGGRQKWLVGIEAIATQPGVLILYDRLLHSSSLDGTVTSPMAVQGNANSGTCTVTSATPGVVTFNAHGFGIGQKIRFTNVGGALPTGISAGVDYYVSKTSYGANVFDISTSYANAWAGTNVATSSTGTGTHTVTGQGPTPALTRYATGAGNFAMFEIYTTIGITARTITMNYTDQGAATGNTSQAVAIGSTTNKQNQQQTVGFMSLADGDTGVRAIDTVTLSASTGTAGDFGITIGHVLAELATGGAGWGVARDLISGFPAMVEILTDACLGLIWCPASTTIPIVYGAIHNLEY